VNYEPCRREEPPDVTAATSSAGITSGALQTKHNCQLITQNSRLIFMFSHYHYTNQAAVGALMLVGGQVAKLHQKIMFQKKPKSFTSFLSPTNLAMFFSTESKPILLQQQKST